MPNHIDDGYTAMTRILSEDTDNETGFLQLYSDSAPLPSANDFAPGLGGLYNQGVWGGDEAGYIDPTLLNVTPLATANGLGGMDMSGVTPTVFDPINDNDTNVFPGIPDLPPSLDNPLFGQYNVGQLQDSGASGHDSVTPDTWIANDFAGPSINGLATIVPGGQTWAPDLSLPGSGFTAQERTLAPDATAERGVAG